MLKCKNLSSAKDETNNAIKGEEQVRIHGGGGGKTKVKVENFYLCTMHEKIDAIYYTCFCISFCNLFMCFLSGITCNTPPPNEYDPVLLPLNYTVPLIFCRRQMSRAISQILLHAAESKRNAQWDHGTDIRW